MLTEIELLHLKDILFTTGIFWLLVLLCIVTIFHLIKHIIKWIDELD